jgi:hypothetical protein
MHSLTRCDVRSLWDLWWFGDLSANVTPYRKFHSFDLSSKEARALMSKASKVMGTLEEIAKLNNPAVNLPQLPMIENRAVFAVIFNTLCQSFAPTLTIDEIDRRHYGTKSYVTFYDLISKSKKRNLEQMEEN